jgi:protein-disulfide isomerase
MAMLLVAALSLPVAAAQRRPHQGTRIAHDWSATASEAPGGAYVIGNPAAKVRLIEYVSLTCPHCAAFAAEGWPALTPYLRAGTVALEVRPAVRDRFDLVATLLARCQGPARYVGNAELLFAHQAEWAARAEQWEDANGAAVQAMPMSEALDAIARGIGLDTLLASRGFTPASVKACLADPASQRAVAAMAAEAWQQRQIAGTPAFIINDLAVDVHDWAGLAPLLADATK